MDLEKRDYSVGAFLAGLFSLFMPFLNTRGGEPLNGFGVLVSLRESTAMFGGLPILVMFVTLIVGFIASTIDLVRMSQFLSAFSIACLVYIGSHFSLFRLGIGFWMILLFLLLAAIINSDAPIERIFFWHRRKSG